MLIHREHIHQCSELFNPFENKYVVEKNLLKSFYDVKSPPHQHHHLFLLLIFLLITCGFVFVIVTVVQYVSSFLILSFSGYTGSQLRA